MKKYAVPYHKQEKNDTCGVACARMLLEYFGHKVSEDELLEEVYVHKFGTWYSDLAKLFIARGLPTAVKTINVHIYSPFWVGEDENKLKSRLEARAEVLKGLLRTECKRAIKYIDMGGKLSLEIPSPKMIEKLIKKQPLMIPVLKSFLNKKWINNAGHYIVLTGFDGKKYSVLDPADGKYQIDKDKLYYAWLANNRGSDGYLMEIAK